MNFKVARLGEEAFKGHPIGQMLTAPFVQKNPQEIERKKQKLNDLLKSN